MKNKIILALFFMLIIVFVFGCAQKDETLGTQVQDEGVPQDIVAAKVDPCEDLTVSNKKLAEMAEELDNAETELEAMNIDLEFAKEDNINVVETEALVKSQSDYIVELNKVMADLQAAIAEC